MAFGQQIRDYQPTKATLLWSVAGAAIITMVLGFTVGGWVTGGTAAKMAQEAGERSAATLAAALCVERFVKADDAAAQLATLKETSRWQRRRFVEDGNWTRLAGSEQPVSGAAELCAAQLADMELPEAQVIDAAADTMIDATAEPDSTIQ